MLAVILLSGVAGGTVGVCVGQIAALFGGPPMVAAIGFLGFLDGATAALMYAALLNRTLKDTGRGGAVALLAIVYAGLGVKVGVAAGLMGLAIVPLCNAAIGVLIGWHVYDSAAPQCEQLPS